MRKKRLPLFEQTRKTVFDRLHSWPDLIERLANIRLKQQEAIHVAVVGSKQNLPNLIEEKCQSFHTSTVRSTKDFQLFRFQRRFGKKTPVTITGDFLVVRPSQEYVYLIVLVSEPDIWKLGVLPLIESLYPRAVQPFLTQPEIHELLKKVQVALAPKSQRL